MKRRAQSSRQLGWVGLAVWGCTLVGTTACSEDSSPPGSEGATATVDTDGVGGPGAAPGAGPSNNASCSNGMTECGGLCVNTAADNLNCGTCGSACNPGEQCSGGACGCAVGYDDCGAGCVDVSSDSANCGACGFACIPPQVCSLGGCSDSCANGLTACGQSCVDLQTSPSNCGTCGIACGGGACVGGVCEVSNAVEPSTPATPGNPPASADEPAVSCDSGLLACGGNCVDPTADPGNCGACYNACPTGTCEDGVCPTVKDCYAPTEVSSTTLADFEDYDGATDIGDYGFAFNGDPGTADAVYAGPYFYDDATGSPTHSMVPGANDSMYAVSTSNSEATDFGGGMGLWMGCIDASAYDGISLWVRGSTPTGTAHFSLAMEETTPPLADDPAGGGTCEATAEGDCAVGGVDIPVTSTWTQLQIPWASFTGATAGGGMAVAVDGHNITGMTFQVALKYVASDPSDPDSEYLPESGGYDLQVDDIEFIEPGVCADGEELCGVGCVDYQTDHDHCGGCGAMCDATRVCEGGTCVCPSGYTDCNGECTNLDIDAQNCGACGASCTGPCEGGSCQESTCTAGMDPVTEVCADAEMITVGKYWLNDNWWGAEGASGTQCVWDTCSSGNTIGWGTSWDWSGGSASQVKSFGSVVLGWHWGWELQNTGLPFQLSENPDVTCGWTYTVDATGTFNVTYDLFTSSDPEGAGDPSEEIMILLRDVDGSAGGLGNLVAEVSVAGTNWRLYDGSNGYWSVYQFIRTANAETGATFNLMDFLNDLIARGMLSADKHLLSIQAGTEVFQGSGRLDTSSFYCNIE